MQGNEAKPKGGATPEATSPLRAVAAGSGGPGTDSTNTPDTNALVTRLQRLERQGKRLRLLLGATMVLLVALTVHTLFPAGTIIEQTLLQSEEVKLIDSSGNTRLFLRMYSRVPVLQLLDNNGKPRMSLGLRFDDTPFIDLSDKTGRTRATFEMTEKDEPTLKLFNANGEVSFAIN